MSTPQTLDAVVLAGGAARRMGGADKPGMAVAGRTMLERVVGAVRDHNGAGSEARVVVVGPPRPSPAALYVREDPPGSGPVPALRAGLAHVAGPLFALLAADMPHLAARHLELLAGAVGGDAAGAVFTDASGREQWLAGVWRTEAVRDALARYTGRSLYGLLGPLGPRTVAAGERAVEDCDTPGDLERARRLLE
ncbi:molybdenum cofactor guanylyltransferase [Nocardiopsis algeriensis]|uniref:Molybdopterin-guanine dinucleotide biosynthesis protein A n=1 Tax=Nocardiopsis algeriensis TaxID=1478215 RepID=A0A841IRH0_9ACTN|nr:molybdopterin-guanine dinucleotide biosynthesis protein A [Nocardiopsis algeriensis]